MKILKSVLSFYLILTFSNSHYFNNNNDKRTINIKWVFIYVVTDSWSEIEVITSWLINQIVNLLFYLFLSVNIL